MSNLIIIVIGFLEKVKNNIVYKYRRKTLLRSFKYATKTFLFDPFSKFVDPHLMSFGDNVFINRGAHLSGEITFGKNIMLGPNVTMISHNHLFGIFGKSNRELSNNVVNKGIIVNDEVWIGNNVTVLSGVEIGMGAVIGAGAVITKNIPPYTIVIGNNKVIRIIFSDERLIKHLKEINYSDEIIVSIIKGRNEMINTKELRVIEKKLSDANIQLNNFK